jgi:hypothetical protein
MKKVLIFFSALLILFILLIPINSNLFAQEDNIEEKVEEILDSCHTMGDPYKSDLLAELGSPAIPILVEKLQSGFSWTIVEALGKIGDKSATPILLERLDSAENSAQELAIIKALAMIGDPGAEPALLSYFEEEQSQGSIYQLEAAQALLKVAGDGSRQKVKEMVSYVRDLYQCAYWTFEEESLDEIFEEFTSSPFDNEEIVHAFLAGLIIDLKDPDLITLAIKYRQLADESGPRFVDGFRVLLESGEPEVIETVFKFAENDQEMWPPAPPDIPQEEKELYFSVHPIIRISAVEALLELKDVDIQRVTQAFEDISLDGTYDVPVTVKFDPEQWDYSWKDEEAASGVITCYLGNLPGYDVTQIKADTIKINNQIAISGEVDVVDERKGFLGEVLKVEFDRSSVLDTMQSVWPGAECLVTISGELNDGGFFSRTLRVQVTSYTEDTATVKVILQPDKWSRSLYRWIKYWKEKNIFIWRFVGQASVKCIIYDLKDSSGNPISINEIVPETIQLNYELSPQPWKLGGNERLVIIIGSGLDQYKWQRNQFRFRYRGNDIILPLMLVRFNMFEAIETLPDIIAGNEYEITISGKLKDGTSFKGITSITITK